MSSNQVTVQSCVKDLVRNEGALSLWKGLTQPMLGAIPITSMVFVTSELTKGQLAHYSPNLTPF